MPVIEAPVNVPDGDTCKFEDGEYCRLFHFGYEDNPFCRGSWKKEPVPIVDRKKHEFCLEKIR